MRLLALTIFALVCFASNSLLTRAAIGGHYMDAWTFMLVRLVSGAITLTALVWLRTAPSRGRGSWLMAAELGGYAVFFTLAYLRLAAGPGALLLFGSVQLTMFATAHGRGERVSVAHWTGVLLALAGFLVLTLPGLSAPDPVGAVLMAGAGVCWAAYTVSGRGSTDPLAVTADNFVRASGIAAVAILAVGLRGPYSPTGFALAAASGAVASGLGYAAWYAVLPSLPVWRAATTQLSVPLLTAVGATVVLREAVHVRLAAAMGLIVLGIWVTNSNQQRSQ
ncbi:MAG: DMT family transporter [Vicinamibacterales bacterium]